MFARLFRSWQLDKASAAGVLQDGKDLLCALVSEAATSGAGRQAGGHRYLRGSTAVNAG